MAYIRIWVHAVWGTKSRIPFLTKDVKKTVIEHIRENAKEKNIYIDSINGHIEHLHCLISLSQDQSISKVMQLIKGEASYWINKNNITAKKFEWADEYYAVSVSDSQVDRVRQYIKNQEEHHKKKSWQEEYTEFNKEYEFDKIKG
jgi:REP-associated tyrosine transposase